jgi:hypothetical protein
LTHGPVEYEQKQEITPTIEAKAKKTSQAMSSLMRGWGHVITEPDEWITRRSHRPDDCIRLFGSRNVVPLVKYVKKQVSGIFEHHAKNLSADKNGNDVLGQRWNEPFEN